MELKKAIEKRHSVRKFSSKKPKYKDILECINSARFAPMAGNNYTLKFILVSDEEKIGKLAEAAQQQFIKQAYYVLVAVSNSSITINLYGKRGEKYCEQQAGAAIENFLLKIEEKGLSSCWIGAFLEYQVKQCLDIPENIDVVAILPIGYEFEKSQRRRKIELYDIMFFNKYGNKEMSNNGL